MHRIQGFIAATVMAHFGLAGAADAQLGIYLDDGKGPFILCSMFDGDTLTKYSTGEVRNNPKAAKRFYYHFDKYKAESGVKQNGSCMTYKALEANYRRSLVPGNSVKNYYGKTVNIVGFAWLPADWATTPVPGEDDDEAKSEPAGLKILTLRYGSGGKGRPGYAHAEIDLNYRFIACMGEVHVAYSLDPKSVRPDSRYMSRDDTMVDAAGTPPPEVSSVGFTATVGANLGSPHVSELASSSRVWMIGEGNAGPALGYGCFSGQTEKLGTVADIVRGKHDVKKVEAILNDALSLGNGLITDPSTLTNAALESGSRKAASEDRTTDDRASGDVSEDRATASESAPAKSAADERYEAAMREYERLEAERQQKIAEIEAAKQEMAAQQAASAERAKAVQDEYQRQLAAHQAQVDAADRARAEYEAQLRAMGLPAPAPTITYSAPAQAPPAAAPAPAQAPPPAASGASTASPAVTTRYYDCYGQIWNRSGSTRVLEAAFYGIVTSQEGKLDFPATDKALKLFIRNTSPDQGSDTENPGAWCHPYDSRMDAERSRERRIQRDSGLPGRRVSLELRM